MYPEKRLECVLSMLPGKIASAVMAIDIDLRCELREIHLRSNRPLCVDISGTSFFLTGEGRLCQSDGMEVTIDDIEKTVNALFRNSFYSYRRELVSGYITIAGGCRAGFCGSAVLDENCGFKVESIKYINSVNIRITREVIGCARELYHSLSGSGLIIAGDPCSGKTTYLRDLTRLIGNTRNVALIDERNEIAGVYQGVPTNDIGSMTDVFTSYNKYEAIISAVRSMNPKVLVCDEIGSDEDLKALEYAVNSGVRVIATCHCSSPDELYEKPVIRSLIDMGAFDTAVFLKNGVVRARRELRETLCSN